MTLNDLNLLDIFAIFAPEPSKENVNLIIDGNKRLRKAFLEGKKEIKAYYLEEKLAKKIRH